MINYRGRQCDRLRWRIAERAKDRLSRALNKAFSAHSRGDSLVQGIVFTMELV